MDGLQQTMRLTRQTDQKKRKTNNSGLVPANQVEKKNQQKKSKNIGHNTSEDDYNKEKIETPGKSTTNIELIGISKQQQISNIQSRILSFKKKRKNMKLIAPIF